MPLKVSSNNKGIWITWGTIDESISSTFRIKPEDDDEKVLEILFKATRFVAAQMGAMAAEVAELEADLMGSNASARHSTTIAFTPTVGPTATPDPSAPRVPMMPPTSLSDRPSDGGPAQSHFGWGSMPTTSVPAQLAAPEAGGWELIPPGEA